LGRPLLLPATDPSLGGFSELTLVLWIAPGGRMSAVGGDNSLHMGPIFCKIPTLRGFAELTLPQEGECHLLRDGYSLHLGHIPREASRSSHFSYG
jgi:hypothetical protein